VHYGGSRARGPFVAVNCAAIPRELAESSFFGHVRGAFTGAHEAHRGYFAQAHGGTLFLDEIGDLPPELQAKLLRTLETGTVTPLGGSQERAVDVRILAATNQELTSLISQDRFREDLYFRLAGFTVAVPPLRSRREDIPLLVDHFLRRYAAEMGREPAGLSREALAMLEGHEFPGNVRELKNLVEYALIRSRGALIRPEHLRFVEFRPGAESAQASAPLPGPAAGRPAHEEERILAYVRDHGSIGNSECRDLLGISLEQARYLLRKLSAQGAVELEGERRWRRYRLPSG
ncbi:MAG: sigma-54-dependent Fis family transcriptional regulator, partial [Candidatus Latescibacteria bacterium]|nr:sigma-54-dependent Fis family transcriptional regulator [Candidatus Latescibacterota bacterium]